MLLKPEEMKRLEESERCTACGHLEALHNQHCCTFCEIEGCPCKWGSIECEDCSKMLDNMEEYAAHRAAAHAPNACAVEEKK